jgi:hypothetical protein
MNPNPFSDRGKALEDQWVREKECAPFVSLLRQISVVNRRRKQMAKDRAAKKQQSESAMDTTDSGSMGHADKPSQEQK